MEVEYLFEDLGGRTRLTEQCDVRAKGFLRVIFVLMGWMMKKSSCDALEKELLNLKRLLEEQDKAG
jgi:hypothetical protein